MEDVRAGARKPARASWNQSYLGWEPVDEGKLDVDEVLGELAEWEAPPPLDDPDVEGLECDEPEDEAPENEDEPPPDECVDPEDEGEEWNPPPLAL
jgi:hypothetical protein